MGHGIAQVFMLAGFNVSIWDPSPETRASVPERVRTHLDQMGSPAEVTIRVCETLEDCVHSSDLVIEAIPEDLELKHALIRELDQINPHCIVATNTSVLRITEIAAYAANPGRIVGTHWWNPPYLIPVVEVIHGAATRTDVVQKVIALLKLAGKVPVEVFKDVPGFVGNRMQFALVREALHIVEEEICSAETVDLVSRLTFGRRLGAVGPLRNADFIGLDLTKAILDYLSPDLSNSQKASPLLEEKLAGNRAGAKSGQGFYVWENEDRDEHEAMLLNSLLGYARRETSE